MIRKLIASATLLAGLAFAGPVWAHAHLVTSDPVVGGTSTPIDTIKITFSEELEIDFCKVEVTMSDGMDMGPAKLALDPASAKVMLVKLPAKLGAGTYKVHWHAVAEDTHHTEGTFDFTVK